MLRADGHLQAREGSPRAGRPPCRTSLGTRSRCWGRPAADRLPESAGGSEDAPAQHRLGEAGPAPSTAAYKCMAPVRSGANLSRSGNMDET